MLTIVIFTNITQPTHPFWFSQHLAIYQVYSFSPLPEMHQLFMSPNNAQGNWNFSRWIPQWGKSDKWQSWGWVQVYWSQNIFLVTWVGLIQPPFYSLQKDLKKKKIIALEPWSSSKPVGSFLRFWWPRAIWIITRLRLVRPSHSLATQ